MTIITAYAALYIICLVSMLNIDSPLIYGSPIFLRERWPPKMCTANFALAAIQSDIAARRTELFAFWNPHEILITHRSERIFEIADFGL
jgi:hypothetical protein